MPAEEAEPSSQRAQQPAWKRLSKRFTLANLGNVLTGGSSSKDTDEDDEDEQEEEQDDQLALSRARSPHCIESLSPSLETPPQTLAAAAATSQETGPAVTRQRSRSLPGSTATTATAAPPILLDPPEEHNASSSSSHPAPAAPARPDISRTLTTLSTSTLHATLYGPQRLDDVPYSYRVPSPKQAFYDSHMGSSSGWNSMKGRAAAVLSLKGVAGGLLPWSDGSKANGEGGAAEAVVDSSEDERPVEDAANNDAGKRRSSSSSHSHLFSLDHLGLSLISQVLPSFGSSPSSAPPRDIDLDLIPRIGPRHPRAREFFKHPSLQLDEAGRPRNVVILGGYRGSVLRSAAPPHQMLWIPLKVGASLRRPTLELGLTPEDEERAREKVIPGETLSRIGKLVDMGARLRSKFERKSKAKVHSWGYDWRLGLGRSSAELQKFLLELYEQSSPDPAQRRGAIVIAHSMGGLVALHTLSQLTNPRAIHTLTFASTPFLGTPNILGPLAWGDATLWNDTICSPEASFSWRSTFYLLPRDGRCFEVAAKTKGTKSEKRQSGGGAKGEGGRKGDGEGGGGEGEEVKTYDVDFLDEEVWKWAAFSPVVKGTKRWIEGAKQREATSPAGDGQQRPPLAAAAAVSANGPNPSSSSKDDTAAQEEGSDSHSTTVWSYLTRTLAEVRQFDSEILSSFSQERLNRGEYPPLTMLTSGRTPTTRGAIVDDDEMPDQQGEAGGGGEEEMEAATATAAAATAAAVASPPSGRSSSRTKDAWRRSVTSLDYSRMVFGRGDGVITLQSSRSVPGRWGELLVKDDEEEGRDAWITQTSHRHVALLSDVDGVGRAVWVGVRARGRWEEEKRRERGEAPGPARGAARGGD